MAFANGAASAQTATDPVTENAVMNQDLLEITIPQLEQLYRSHKYTVTDVVLVHGADRQYNGIYRAVQTLDRRARWRRRLARMRRQRRAAAVLSAGRCGAFRS